MIGIGWFLFLSFLLFFLLGCWFIKRKEKELLENNWENFKKIYNKKITELEQDYKAKRQKIEEEIKEKENFNNTLFKVREEEVDRLIEEKKKERLLLLDEQMNNYQNQERQRINRDLEKYLLNIQEKKKISEEELAEIQNHLEDFRSQREAVNEAVLREKQIQEEEDFYRICIPKESQEDIEVLKSVAPKLQNKEALNKLIYDVFVRRPLNEMIKRVTGGQDISGIYKITYLKTGESYIGKSTNIGTRWQNHCKTAIGLSGGAAKSTVHDHMGRNGLWNYSWEILEEVPKDKLSDREKFYIELYQTNKQLNMRIG